MFTPFIIIYLYKVVPTFLNSVFTKIKKIFKKDSFLIKNKLRRLFYKRFYKFYIIKESTLLFKEIIKAVGNEVRTDKNIYKFLALLIKLLLKWPAIVVFSLIFFLTTLYCELFIYKTCIFYTIKYLYPGSIYLRLIQIKWIETRDLIEFFLCLNFIVVLFYGPILHNIFEYVCILIITFIYQFIQKLSCHYFLFSYFFTERLYNIYYAFCVTIKFITTNLYYYSNLFFIFFKDLLISIICNNWRLHLNKWFNFSKNEQFILNKIHLLFTNTFWENTIIMSINISHIVCIILVLKTWECSQTFNKYQFVSGFFFIILNSWILLNTNNNLFLLTLIILTELTSIFLLTIVLINVLVSKKNTKSLSLFWLLSLTFLTINTTSYTYFNYYISVPVQTNPLVNFTYICYTTNSFIIIWFIVILTWLILVLLNTVKGNNKYYNIFYLLSSTTTFINKIVDNLNIFCEPFITKWNSKKKK